MLEQAGAFAENLNLPTILGRVTNTQSPVGVACHHHYEDDIHSMLQCTIRFLRKTTDKNAVM